MIRFLAGVLLLQSAAYARAGSAPGRSSSVSSSRSSSFSRPSAPRPVLSPRTTFKAVSPQYKPVPVVLPHTPYKPWKPVAYQAPKRPLILAPIFINSRDDDDDEDCHFRLVDGSMRKCCTDDDD